MAKADIGSKRLLETEPETWVRWVLGDDTLQVASILSGEFEFVLRYNDVLLQVEGPEGPFLVLAESQLHVVPDMPLRMRAYTALAEEKYRQDVYPVVFFWLPPSPGVELPACYHREFRGMVAHQDFHPVAAWEIDAHEVLNREVLGLIPFVPLMKGADEEVVREGVSLLRERNLGEEAEVVLALFASYVMIPADIQRIVRWNMEVLRESPWYKQIVEEGLQQGLQQGLQKGHIEGEREAILKVLQARFDLSSGMGMEIDSRLTTIANRTALEELVTVATLAEDIQTFLDTLAQFEG